MRPHAQFPKGLSPFSGHSGQSSPQPARHHTRMGRKAAIQSVGARAARSAPAARVADWPACYASSRRSSARWPRAGCTGRCPGSGPSAAARPAAAPPPRPAARPAAAAAGGCPATVSANIWRQHWDVTEQAKALASANFCAETQALNSQIIAQQAAVQQTAHMNSMWTACGQ